MKKSISSEILIEYIESKTSQMIGDAIIYQINPFEGLNELSNTDALNKMYEIGHQRGIIIGQTEILSHITSLIKTT